LKIKRLYIAYGRACDIPTFCNKTSISLEVSAGIGSNPHFSTPRLSTVECSWLLHLSYDKRASECACMSMSFAKDQRKMQMKNEKFQRQQIRGREKRLCMKDTLVNTCNRNLIITHWKLVRKLLLVHAKPQKVHF
jgi:hypothetical protein